MSSNSPKKLQPINIPKPRDDAQEVLAEQPQQEQPALDSKRPHHHQRAMSMGALFSSAPATSLLSRLARLGFSSPPRKEFSSLPKVDDENVGGSDSSHGTDHSRSSSMSSAASTSPTGSYFSSYKSKSPPPHDGVESALVDSSADVGGGSWESRSPLASALPELSRARTIEEGSRPARRSSIGPGSLLFGSSWASSPDNGLASAWEPGKSPTASSPVSESGFGLFRKMSVGSGSIGKPPLSPTSARNNSLPGDGTQAPPPTPSSAYSQKPLPALAENPEARGRTLRRGSESKRKISPMGERMLRGPFHD